MAQVAIREYDAKRLWSVRSEIPYTGILVETHDQINTIANRLKTEKPLLRVVKPDQLFGKRGKHGLVGIKLDADGVQKRCEAHWQKLVTIDGITDVLHTFLIEPWIAHTQEWYVSFETNREGDLIRLSTQGGIAIEEHWDSIHEIRVPVLEELDPKQITLPMDAPIKAFIVRFFQFFKEQWFTSLEINPFVVDDAGIIYCLDMVAKVDSCELWRQQLQQQYVSRVKPFGSRSHPSEAIVESIDAKTGASLKLTIVNPEGRLWFLLWGWWASVIVMDTLAWCGLLHEVANYGELSWNPDESSNRAYVNTLIETMLANKKSDQYLFLVWGIANFTDIVALVKPLCDCLVEHSADLIKQNITLVMRRWGLRVEEAMILLRDTCVKQWIRHKIYDDTLYLTKIVESIEF
jgi:succinyl-CoA synthetase beta subunit